MSSHAPPARTAHTAVNNKVLCIGARLHLTLLPRALQGLNVLGSEHARNIYWHSPVHGVTFQALFALLKCQQTSHPRWLVMAFLKRTLWFFWACGRAIRKKRGRKGLLPNGLKIRFLALLRIPGCRFFFFFYFYSMNDECIDLFCRGQCL